MKENNNNLNEIRNKVLGIGSKNKEEETLKNKIYKKQKEFLKLEKRLIFISNQIIVLQEQLKELNLNKKEEL